jgi:DNA polymerase-3 subunit epsilon
MKILGLDYETTGLDPKRDYITEAGLVMWDSDTKQPARITGFLVKTPAPVSAEITQLTGITNELLANYGVEPKAALTATLGMIAQADFIAAHNGTEFDKLFLEADCARQGQTLKPVPWIDTRTDLPVAAYQLGKSASLKYLACDHGFVYPAHRAVNDVLAMFEIMGRYDLNEIIKRAQTPNVRVRAVVSFDERLLAKERGYYWKPELKLWIKPLKADEVDAEKLAAPFPVVLMEAA